MAGLGKMRCGTTIILENQAGNCVGKLYFMEDGNLHPDSWIQDARSQKESVLQKKKKPNN